MSISAEWDHSTMKLKTKQLCSWCRKKKWALLVRVAFNIDINIHCNYVHSLFLLETPTLTDLPGIYCLVRAYSYKFITVPISSLAGNDASDSPTGSSGGSSFGEEITYIVLGAVIVVFLIVALVAGIFGWKKLKEWKERQQQGMHTSCLFPNECTIMCLFLPLVAMGKVVEAQEQYRQHNIKLDMWLLLKLFLSMAVIPQAKLLLPGLMASVVTHSVSMRVHTLTLLTVTQILIIVGLFLQLLMNYKVLL